MSGGHFNYAYGYVYDFANMLDGDIKANERGLSPETLEILKQECVNISRCAKVMHDIEWLFSYDTDEETFLEDYKKRNT